jgi:cob(I)alamin adenosyltransferase
LKPIYTKRGDQGETGLLYGGRVSKSDARVRAYGAVDEAVSALGLARSLCQDPWVRDRLLEVQRELFIAGSELATSRESYALLRKHFAVIEPEMTARLEDVIDSISMQIELPRSFIVPGASSGSGAVDLARATLRRAEREAVSLSEAGLLENRELLRYLNRLADLLFMLARFEDRALPLEPLTGTQAGKSAGRTTSSKPSGITTGKDKRGKKG